MVKERTITDRGNKGEGLLEFRKRNRKIPEKAARGGESPFSKRENAASTGLNEEKEIEFLRTGQKEVCI